MELCTFELINSLVAVDGLSGAERPAAQYATQLLRKYGETHIDKFGNVICTVGEHVANKPTLLLDAHIDEIGMIVTYVTDDGFLKVSNVGGLDDRVLQGQRVKIYAKETLDGVIISTPPHLSADSSDVLSAEELYIDTGLTGDEAKSIISLGDRVCIYNTLKAMNRDTVTSHALDDRAGCGALILVADMLDLAKSKYNVTVMLSAQEETGQGGAKTGAFSVDCDEAIIVDVSFAQTRGESECGTGKLGSGAMIGFSPSLCKDMSLALLETAKRNDLPYQIEVMSGRTGTNADVIGVSKSGVKTATLSIPLKNMHTPVETISLSDIENTARLVCAYAENR